LLFYPPKKPNLRQNPGTAQHLAFLPKYFKVLHGGEKQILKIVFPSTAKTHPFPTKTLLMSQALFALQAVL